MKIEADIKELIHLVSAVTEAHTTAFLMADNQKRVLKLFDFCSLSDNIIRDAIIPYGYGPIGWVADNIEPFDLSKFTDRDSGMLKLYSKNEEIKAFAAVPVLREDSLVGVLCVDSKSSFIYTNKEQKLLTIFAKLFADFMNNINLMEYIDAELSSIKFLHDFCRKLSFVNRLDLITNLAVESIMDLLKCNDCFICLKTDEKDPYFYIEAVCNHRNLKNKVFTERDGLAGCVISDKRTILLENRGNDLGSSLFKSSMSVSQFSSFMGIPLSYQNKVFGIICVIDKRKYYFKSEDMQIVSIIADNIAIAISSIIAQKKILDLLKSIAMDKAKNNRPNRGVL